ncbi:hypothetical protein B0H11DRAFT_1900101 [Mycena galericulata]|nr:hypothetical protein B0H11DRAFT_1900101 [Mycena galericulata]
MPINFHTDGEAPERGWAEVNTSTGSSKEMGAGTRHEQVRKADLIADPVDDPVQLESAKGTDANSTPYEWLPGLDKAYQEYLDDLKTATTQAEAADDISEDSMDLGFVDDDDREDQISEPWVINIDRPYSAGSAEERQMQLLTDACWPRKASHAVGTGSHIVGSRFNVGVPLAPYRFLDERTDPREFSLLEGIHMRLSCPLEEFEKVAHFLDSK